MSHATTTKPTELYCRGDGKIYAMNEKQETLLMEHLREEGLFRRLSDEALRAVIATAHTLTVAEDAFLFYQDDPAERVFVLTQGRMRLGQLSPDGQQVIMRVATPWMLIAAIGMVTGALYPVSAQAAEPSQVLYWNQPEMLALIERYPDLALNAMRLLAGHVREFQDRYREMATERVERRLARALQRLADQVGRKTPEGLLLDLPLTRQDLAEMIGATLYTVSRIFSQWESQGLVLVGREKVVIRSLPGLASVADDFPNNP
jgi:CRP/FNR family transcriptional regulator, nitrogen oxide reductase regulator